MYTPAREPACAFEHVCVLGCTCASACECRPVWYAAQRYSHTQAHVHVRGRSGRAPSLATRKHSTSRLVTPRPHELSHGPHSVARQRNCSPHEPAWHGCDTRSMSRCCVDAFIPLRQCFRRRTIAIITLRSIKGSLSRRCKTFSPISRSDCDAWRKARDTVHIGAFQLRCKLPCVRGHAVQKAPLSLRKQQVEGEGGFS